MPLFQSPPASICIVRLSAIGDCCHALALVRVILRQWPSTRITWITGKLEASLFADLPGVEVITFDKSQGWQAYLALWRTLKGRRFDALLHLQAAIRASLLTLRIKAPIKMGFDRQRANDGQWLFTNYRVPSPSSPHVLDGFLAFAQALGVSDLTPDWQLPIAPAQQQWATEKVAGKPTLLICAAASKAFKNWTAQGYAAVADHASRQGFQVFLCGGPSASEQQLAQQIAHLSQHKPTNLVGQTNLKQLLALIAQAQMVLAPDTGPAHMATIVGTPVIGLYAHHNPARTGPYHCRDYVVSVYQPLIEQQTGKPLAQLPWRTRLTDPNAMAQIQPTEVIAMFDKLCAKLALGAHMPTTRTDLSRES